MPFLNNLLITQQSFRNNSLLRDYICIYLVNVSKIKIRIRVFRPPTPCNFPYKKQLPSLVLGITSFATSFNNLLITQQSFRNNSLLRIYVYTW